MRDLTYFFSEQIRIDVYKHLFWGQEKIFYNGSLFAAAYALFGATHRFKVMEANLEAEYVIVSGIRNFLRVRFDIFRNGKALLLS